MSQSANRENMAPRKMPSELSRVDEHVFRPDNATNHTSVSHNLPADNSSISSNDSTRMIIKKEVQWQIDSESQARANSGMDMYDLEMEEGKLRSR